MMTSEQMEWCLTLSGNCVQCKYNNTCDLCRPACPLDCPQDCAECPEFPEKD